MLEFLARLLPTPRRRVCMHHIYGISTLSEAAPQAHTRHMEAASAPVEDCFTFDA